MPDLDPVPTITLVFLTAILCSDYLLSRKQRYSARKPFYVLVLVYVVAFAGNGVLVAVAASIFWLRVINLVLFLTTFILFMRSRLPSLILPYTGKQRILATTLSTDECLCRLREEVRQPRLSQFSFGWMPLATNSQLVRKIQDQHFLIRPMSAWCFFGMLKARNGSTTVVGQYRLTWSAKVYWWVRTGFGGLMILPTLLLLIGATIVNGEISKGSVAELLIVGIIPVVLAVLLKDNRESNAIAQSEENQIVAVLEQLFDAEEETPVQQ